MGKTPRPVFRIPIARNIMGLRFSILGFSQERALEIRATAGGKELRLDVIDLLLLSQVADFPNRSNVMKIIEEDKIFYWIAYSEMLEELPILCLKKQALRDRFDKLVTLGLLEKKTRKSNNMTFFRLTNLYEKLKYGAIIYNTEQGCVVNDGGVYSDTQGVCSGLHTISEDKYIKILKEKEYKEKERESHSHECSECDLFGEGISSVISMPTLEEKESKGAAKAERDAKFEDLWQMYERKGSKANAKKEFAKLTDAEIAQMQIHIPAYLQSRPEKRYRQDFERYIKNRTFNSVVYGAQNEVLYDPEAPNCSATHAQEEFKRQNEPVTISGVTYR